MDNKILSIAVPAYNMQNYISRCLDSLISPSSIDKIEIIIINDGSTDNTLSIAQKYAEQYPNSIKIIDKSNGGWGSAINAGIRLAKGKYFKILDSDDWFDTNALNSFCNLLTKIDVDLVASSFSYVYENKASKDKTYDINLCNKKIKFTDYLRNHNFQKDIPMASISFKTKLLQNNKIEVCNRYYADIDYNLTPLIYVDTIYFTQINLYRYYIGRDGQSTSIEGYKKHLSDYIIMCKKLVAFYCLNKNIISEPVKKAYIIDCSNAIRFVYYLFLSPRYNKNKIDSISELKKFDKELKIQSKSIYNKVGQFRIKKIIPYIKIWRYFHINILNIKK